METTLNLRVDEPLKALLLKQAEIYGTTLSNYCRDVLISHIDDLNDLDTSYIDSDEDEDDNYHVNEESSDIPYEKTYAFTCLLTWLFCRHMHPHDNNSKSILTSLKLKVERVLAESSFSNELKLEFLKVLGDLNRFLLEPDYEGKKFEFPLHGNHLSFDYFKLMNEIWSLEIPML